ncbi:MAG TPA: metallophosphoesterase, partial [Hyphomicrobiaceae bacterium]|nr:metallophosphoesterase [Hyphomicrobiaceae bacterium]
GGRVRVVDRSRGRLGASLEETLAPHLASLIRFADCAKPWLARELTDLWPRIFPLVLPPDGDDGLGIMLLDSNADTHFSFTNALGMISVEQVKAVEIARAQYPQARWLIALHHHLIEYPRTAKAFSERIGTALINGNWFIRRLRPCAGQVALLHGHRHFDWIGECAGLLILSAPSPVMHAPDHAKAGFYVHTFVAAPQRQLRLLPPQRITLDS